MFHQALKEAQSSSLSCIMSKQTPRWLHPMRGITIASEIIVHSLLPYIRGGSSHWARATEAQVVFRQSSFPFKEWKPLSTAHVHSLVMDLDHIPLVAPTPPHVSNFVDPPTFTTTLVVVSALCLALMIPFAALRLYCKAFIVRSFGWDDGGFKVKLRFALLSVSKELHCCNGELIYQNWPESSPKVIRLDR